jgi:hypothetical protein
MYNVAKQRSGEGEELRTEGWRYRSVLTLLDVRQPDTQYPGRGTSDSLRPIWLVLGGNVKKSARAKLQPTNCLCLLDLQYLPILANTFLIVSVDKAVAMKWPSRDFFFGGDLQQLPQ